MLALLMTKNIDNSIKELTVEVNRRFKEHAESLPFNVLVSTVKTDFPNMKNSDYLTHSNTPLVERMRIAEELATIIRGQAYNDKAASAIDLLTDFILAEDHARGLMLKRSPNNEESALEELRKEYPPLGEGAQEYMRNYIERQYIGVPLSIGEKRQLAKLTVKRCEICESEFIDRTKNGIAKVCGDSCRKEKERRRQKRLYNNNVYNIDEARYKRDWQRQQYEYPFFSPKELYELLVYGEIVLNADSFNRGKLSKKAYTTIDGERSPHDYGGRKKPVFKSLNEIENDKNYEKLSQRYDPRGNDRRELNWKNLKDEYDRNCGEVISYHITELDRSKDFSVSRKIHERLLEIYENRVVEKCI